MIFEDENGATFVKSISDSAELTLVEVVDEHIEYGSVDVILLKGPIETGPIEEEESQDLTLWSLTYIPEIYHIYYFPHYHIRDLNQALGAKMNQKLRAVE